MTGPIKIKLPGEVPPGESESSDFRKEAHRAVRAKHEFSKVRILGNNCFFLRGPGLYGL
jgi:hypothetical protein